MVFKVGDKLSIEFELPVLKVAIKSEGSVVKVTAHFTDKLEPSQFTEIHFKTILGEEGKQYHKFLSIAGLLPK
jgi:hypothetical protein